MKQSEQRYAMNRLQEVFQQACRDLKAKHTKPQEEPSTKEKLRALQQWKVDFKRSADLLTPVGQAFDFSVLSQGETLDQKALEKDMRTLRKVYGLVRDEVMLGDEAKAKNLIRSFCDKYAT
jgi:hypothetical protein